MTYGNTIPDAPQGNPQQSQVSQPSPTPTQQPSPTPQQPPPAQNQQPQSNPKPGNGKTLLISIIIIIILAVGILYYTHVLSSQPNKSSSYTAQTSLTSIATNASTPTSKYSNSSEVKSAISQNYTYYINRNVTTDKAMPLLQFEDIVNASYSSTPNLNVSYTLSQKSNGTQVNVQTEWNTTFEKYQGLYYYKTRIGFGGNIIIIRNASSIYLCLFNICKKAPINASTEAAVASSGLPFTPTPLSVFIGQYYASYLENTTLQFTSVSNSTYSGIPCTLITGDAKVTHVPKNGTATVTIVNNTEKATTYNYTNQTKPFSFCMSSQYYVPLNLSFQMPGPYPGEISGHYVTLNTNANYSFIDGSFKSNSTPA